MTNEFGITSTVSTNIPAYPHDFTVKLINNCTDVLTSSCESTTPPQYFEKRSKNYISATEENRVINESIINNSNASAYTFHNTVYPDTDDKTIETTHNRNSDVSTPKIITGNNIVTDKSQPNISLENNPWQNFETINRI